MLYIHIPKTAGTSLKNSLRKDVELIFNVEHMKDFPCPPQHFHFDLLKQLGFTQLCQRHFTITRHPIDRFISEFSYRKKIDAKFRYINLTTFFIFCKTVYPKHRYLLANHIRPQSDFVGENTEVFKLEDGLESVLCKFKSLFEENAPRMPRKNTSNSNLIEIDAKTFMEIREFYNEDFKKFKYEADATTAKVTSHKKLNYFVSYVLAKLLVIVFKITKLNSH